ncbi:type II toxin-antitoxin system PemK/MazF family toxin [Candidatus Peregrinibacteria bacterium]|nr:type II toxin-antitoxin system PemK/MazF family toxin [Candidatus Peregrinibacteria bacterium]
MRKISQGTIYLADLNPIKGHEQAGKRPVVVLQNNILNKNLNTVIIAPLTKNLNAKGLLTTYYLSSKTTKLKYDSVVLLHQIRAIDITRLKQKIVALSTYDFASIREQLSLLF